MRDCTGPIPSLFVLIACAHALVTGFSAAAVRTRVDLNRAERAAFLITAVVRTTVDSATNAMIRFFMAHKKRLLIYFAGEAILPRARKFMPADFYSQHIFHKKWG